MTPPIDPTNIAAKARELLAQRDALRISAVEDLARVQADRERLRTELAAADAAFGVSYSAALKGGWAPDDLAAIGLPADKPGRAGQRIRVGGRKRATATPDTPDAPGKGTPGDVAKTPDSDGARSPEGGLGDI